MTQILSLDHADEVSCLVRPRHASWPAHGTAPFGQFSKAGVSARPLSHLVGWLDSPGYIIPPMSPIPPGMSAGTCFVGRFRDDRLAE